MSDQPVVNTDRELWREVEGDYYSPSIHVTADGGIGINVGGSVFVKPIREWHKLAAALLAARRGEHAARETIRRVEEWRAMTALNSDQDATLLAALAATPEEK